MRNTSFRESLAYRISAKNRAKKFAFFLDSFHPTKETTILDVGVNANEYSATDNYLEKHYPFQKQITAVCLEDVSHLQKLYPQVKFLQTDGRTLPFSDNEFDIVYSNAVIEHVGNFDAQKEFLQELARVGKALYLTTPNKHFPIEVHTRVPFFHWLPKPIFDAFLRLIGKTWATGEYMRLLTQKELRDLVQQTGLTNSTITKNRFLGFSMTFTLIWKK